ncbi:toll/interleukin-1 receptor domain-containing adapter protein isoform X2 [Salminus brasiliensis]|uniref:toll/interleukin-1 receptor domain-containing adapter protein isoform X2 n=1 Tax=Salminus brasiliensis TaxID=930266 RepID=UPI003B83426B
MEENYGSSIIDWFRQRFRKSKNEPISHYRSKHTQNTEPSSSVNPADPSMDAGPSSCVNSSSDTVTHTDCNCAAQSEPLPLSHCTCASQGSSPRSTPSFRWTCRYDVFVCHSDENIAQAHALASFLEAPSRELRCYLQTRDCPLGGAVSSELCKAVQSSHCWVLLISPSFLQDDWCLYQMHQTLCEGPMSQRIIPAVLDMHISEIPHELRFFYIVDLNRNHEAGYTQT